MYQVHTKQPLCSVVVVIACIRAEQAYSLPCISINLLHVHLCCLVACHLYYIFLVYLCILLGGTSLLPFMQVVGVWRVLERSGFFFHPIPPPICFVLFCSAATPVPPLSVADMSYTPDSQVSVSVSAASKADSWEGDMLVLLAFQQEDKEAFGVLAGPGAEAADKALDGAATDMISTQEFKVRVEY